MRGPASRTSPIEVHPIVVEDAFYRSSDLCGRCHELELAQWKEAPPPADGPKPTCQECHMQAVRRKVESVHDEHAYSALFVAMGREQDLRRHGFDVPADIEEWVTLTPARERGGGIVRIDNRVPHALPTGAFGRRRIGVLVSWPGGSARHELAGGLPEAGRRPGAPLAAGETRRLPVRLPEGVRLEDVEARLERWDRKEGRWTPLLGSEHGRTE